ncbi:hypothetical protein CP8484711_1636A, partial [Chlamydia psittaci 84-8471/1]
MPVPLHY